MAARKTTRPKPEQRPLNVVYYGNFGAEHSTENHVARALETNGHSVARVQENEARMWPREAALIGGTEPDLILWTRTGWDYTQYGYESNDEALKWQMRFLLETERRGIPTVGFHLDLFHGLNPEREAIVDEPFFQCDLVVTADGGSQDWFTEHHVNHHWMPPGVSAPECEPGMFRDEFHSKLAFVGSWQGHYHPESQHRFELVRWLQENFPTDCAFWPKQGQPAVRGADLRDLYASVDVVVGDSCLVGTGHANYWSDRIPETLGRGGFLLHPNVPGLDEQHWTLLPWRWEAYDWAELGHRIEAGLIISPAGRLDLIHEAREDVLAHHTYEVRMRQLVELLNEKGLLR